MGKLELTDNENKEYLDVVLKGNMDKMFDLGLKVGIRYASEQLIINKPMTHIPKESLYV